jgi:hypothetical protein
MRATGYRRVLMSQLLNDNRIKEYVAEILNDEKMLPRPSDNNRPALPERASDARRSRAVTRPTIAAIIRLSKNLPRSCHREALRFRVDDSPQTRSSRLQPPE